MKKIADTLTGSMWLIEGTKIRTDFVYPPIPDRRFDWCAYRDDDEPNDNGNMMQGNGASEAEPPLDSLALSLRPIRDF